MNLKLLPLLMVLSGLWGSLFANHLSSNLMFTAKMSGDQEVPAVTTDGQGLAIFTFDEERSTLYVNVSINNLSGPITGIHIHEGEVGVNGGVIYNLTPFLNGNRVKATIPNISRESFAKFLSGDYYINAHTDLHTGGEIRGQIGLETDYSYVAELSGDQEVPEVATDGIGLFVSYLTHSGKLMKFTMVFEGLTSEVTGAHIHHAPAGANGGVVFDLGPFLSGNFVFGSWDPSEYLDELRAGELYVNVHTADNTGGEIRGQLLLQEGLMFEAILNGDQENPPVDTKGVGVGYFRVSPDLSTLQYYALTDSLSGEITGAHFHAGTEGNNGGVIIDLTDHIDENIINGSLSIDDEFLNRMLRGGIYINLHTDLNPGGEIRGQVNRLAREGFLFDMNGGQEVPPVTTTGTGVGMVSIDRSQENAHYMIVYSNLLGDFTLSHFHNGAPGVNGPVIHDIGGSFNQFGAADGYWDTGFDASSALLFRNHEVYANVHTTQFGGGEIRGNVVRASELFFDDKPFDPGFGNDFMLTAELNGSNEEPQVTTDGLGLATFYFGADRTTVHVNVTVTGLSSAITGAHIHEGFPGENGPVIFPLVVEGNRIQMEIPNVTSEQLGKFISGNYYINVHTSEHMGGEIRGQINIDQDATFIAVMNGDQENPSVTTDARGLGVFHYTWGDTTLDVNIQVTELSSNITGAHLHTGAVGENGPVLFDLSTLRDGNRWQGTISGLTGFDIINILLGNVYVNVHTSNHTGGEIRGQLFYQNGLSFDGWMSGAQEVPFAVTPASGLAAATVSPDLTTVQFWMVSDQVSGTITAAHFHNATVGNNGGVALDLGSGLDDNDINFSGPISDAAVSALLSGGIYANVHTAAFPAGEMRGQLFRLARDGYGFDMCTEQETGIINAPNATGNGYASIDRLHTNANLAMAVDGLTGPITASHIHEAPIGTNGGVIFPFPAFQDFISGYGVPIDSSVIAAIRTGNAYFNVHTSTHTGGEIRGQVVKEFLCTVETGLNELGEVINEILLTPVPVTDQLNVLIEAKVNSELTFSVFDLSGKIMSTDKFQLTQGQNIIHVDTELLGPGFYTLMLSDGNAAQAYKFVK